MGIAAGIESFGLSLICSYASQLCLSHIHMRLLGGNIMSKMLGSRG